MLYGWSNEARLYHLAKAPAGYRGWTMTCCGERWVDHVSTTPPSLVACDRQWSSERLSIREEAEAWRADSRARRQGRAPTRSYIPGAGMTG